MAAPSYTTDLTDITTAETTTGWSALGGGASGLSVEPDFTIQGSNCIAKQIKAETKGHVFNVAVTPGAADHVYTWIYVSTPGTTDTIALGGLRVTIGSTTTAREEYYVAGSDTYAKGGWICYPISQELRGDATVGTPSASLAYWGAVMKGTVTVKAPNLGVDVIRVGSEVYVDAGEVADEATILAAASKADLVANSWGLIQQSPSGVLLQGLCKIGSITAAYHRESNITIIFPDNNPSAQVRHTLIDLKGISISNASTDSIFTSVTFLSLDRTDRGYITVDNASSSVEFTACSFQNMARIEATANTTIDSCSFTSSEGVRNTDATITNNAFTSSSGIFKITNMFLNLDTGVVATQPNGVDFGDSGLLLITTSRLNSSISVFSLSVAYDLSSTRVLEYSFDQSLTTITEATQFNLDGTKLFVLGDDEIIRESTLSTAWDCQDASRTDTANSVTLTGTTLFKDFKFNDDGTRIVAIGLAGRLLIEYSLATAFDLSSTFTELDSIYIRAEHEFPQSFDFSDDGAVIYMTDATYDICSRYELETAYALDPIPVQTGKNTSITFEAGSNSVKVDPTGVFMYLGGSSFNNIKQLAVSYCAIESDDLTGITGNSFTSSGTGHAINISTTTSGLTMTWDNTDSGYASVDGSTGNETIFVSMHTGVMTIIVAAGATTPTIRTNGAVVTVQNVANTFSFTIDPLTVNYEWRLYEKDVTNGTIGTVELDGEESALSTSQTYSYQYASDTDVVLQIIADGYEEFQLELTLGNANQDRTINLTPEDNL